MWAVKAAAVNRLLIPAQKQKNQAKMKKALKRAEKKVLKKALLPATQTLKALLKTAVLHVTVKTSQAVWGRHLQVPALVKMNLQISSEMVRAQWLHSVKMK